MRITKQSTSNSNLVQVLRKINKRQQSSFSNKNEINNNKNILQSFLQNNQGSNEEPIKVQLIKNNNNKKIYSTKTIDIKTLYNNQILLNPKNIENDYTNFESNKRKMSSNNLQKQNYKNIIDSNGHNYAKNNNTDNLNRYKGIGPQGKYNSNINSPKIISDFPSQNIQHVDEATNYRIDNTQPKHKIRDLFSKKFLYNKPKTTSTPNNLKKNPHPYDLKTYHNNNNYNNMNLNNIDNISVNSFSINRKERNVMNRDNLSAISMDDAYTLMKNNYNYNYYNNTGINLKLDDLIICDEKLNDILIALNNKNKGYDMDASNECAEFFVYYFHSTLQNLFYKFYNEKKKIIIDSANNLTLLSILVTYHLSLNKDILREVINIIINILSLLKTNLYLNVKKIQIYFGDSFVEKNNFYFKTFNYYLKIQNLINIREEEIALKIEQNCRIITNQVKKILKLYQQKNDKYYNDFIVLFNNISILTENDFKDYFYVKLYNKINIRNKEKSRESKKYNQLYNDKEYYEKNNNNINNNDEIDNSDVISVKSNKSSHYYGKIDRHNLKILKLINDYEKSKIDPPFIKTPNKKKYSLVLDLDETLINVEFKDKSSNKCILHLRPGLFSFLSKVKPFYELITFTSASKEYAQPIINEIELDNKYFDYNFFREHSVISGNDFVKDISRIGRDMKKIIIIDNMEQNFRLNKKNGIKIKAFYGDQNDKILFELCKILVMIVKQGYEDLTLALQNYSNEIKIKISMEN